MTATFCEWFRPMRILQAAALLALATAAPTQCTFDWQAGAPSPGPNGPIRALLAEPGGGVIAAGSFTLADAVFANSIARWNGVTWQALGSGVDDRINCLARLPNGDVVAGGAFTAAGGQPANRIARWNGNSWSPLGAGFDGVVDSLLVLPNGDLIAGGAFTSAGAVPVARIARWNGVAWSAIGSGFQDGEVMALAQRPNGDLVAGGTMFGAGNGDGLQRWDGVSWQVVPGFIFPIIQAMAVQTNGDLVVAGHFYVNSQEALLARWDGVSAQAIAQPSPSNVAPASALLAASNGDLWWGGPPTVGGTISLARWNGTQWTVVTGGPDSVLSLAQDASGRLLVGADPGVVGSRTVRRYDGVAWQVLGASEPPVVSAAVRLANGDVVVGGSFSSFGGAAANNLARWNGTSWSSFGGAGVDGAVTALAAAANGDVVVSGNFHNAGGAPANRVARWNGQVWTTLGAGLDSPAARLLVRPSGDVLASTGPMPALRFDGITWTQVSVGSVNIVRGMALLPNGDAVLGGVFLPPGSPVTGLVRYDAAGSVSTIPGAPSSVSLLTLRSDGTLVVAPSMRSWDGTQWTSLPTLSGVTGLWELPNGELLAGGAPGSQGGAPASALFRLRSTGWQSFGAVAGGAPTVAASSIRGDLFVGGSFQIVDGQVRAGFAHGVPTCAADSAVVGSGCSGGAGPVTLHADNLPWVGGVFRASATGMTTNSLALQVLGLTPTLVPLPVGAPGCSLFVTPDVTGLLVPAGGVAAAAFTVPNQASLVGQLFRLQVVGVELQGSAIVRLTSTNALQSTIGAL